MGIYIIMPNLVMRNFGMSSGRILPQFLLGMSRSGDGQVREWLDNENVIYMRVSSTTRAHGN
jgi:hypothetical protein